MSSLHPHIALDGIEAGWESQEAGSSVEQGVANTFMGLFSGLGLGLLGWGLLYVILVAVTTF